MGIKIEHNASFASSTSGSSTSSKGRFKSYSGSRRSSSERLSVSSGVTFSANSILKIIALLLLVFSFCSVMFGHGYHFTLETLLQNLTSLPEVNMSVFLDKLTIPSITSDWGVFNFFRVWINGITSTLNGFVAFIGFFGVGFVQLFSLLQSLISGL